MGATQFSPGRDSMGGDSDTSNDSLCEGLGASQRIRARFRRDSVQERDAVLTTELLVQSSAAACTNSQDTCSESQTSTAHSDTSTVRVGPPTHPKDDASMAPDRQNSTQPNEDVEPPSPPCNKAQNASEASVRQSTQPNEDVEPPFLLGNKNQNASEASVRQSTQPNEDDPITFVLSSPCDRKDAAFSESCVRANVAADFEEGSIIRAIALLSPSLTQRRYLLYHNNLCFLAFLSMAAPRTVACPHTYIHMQKEIYMR
jgi:hypothetical protein